jgi:hypothetical protein
MVAGGHQAKPPSTLAYASVVSRDSVRIALTMAALHDLQVKTGIYAQEKSQMRYAIISHEGRLRWGSL